MAEKFLPRGYATGLGRLVEQSRGEYTKHPATLAFVDPNSRQGTLGGGTSKEAHRRARKKQRLAQAKRKPS